MWQHGTNNATMVYDEASQIQSTGKVMINRMLAAPSSFDVNFETAHT